MSTHNGTLLLFPSTAAGGREWDSWANATDAALQVAGRLCPGRDASALALQLAGSLFLDLARIELAVIGSATADKGSTKYSGNTAEAAEGNATAMKSTVSSVSGGRYQGVRRTIIRGAQSPPGYTAGR